MLKKYVAILLLLIANAIILGHNLVPHHHHISLDELAEHHGAGQHQHGGEEEQGLGGLLSHIIHQLDSYTVNKDSNEIFNQQFVSLALVSHMLSLHEDTLPLILHKPQLEHLLYSHVYITSVGLRGPPVLMA